MSELIWQEVALLADLQAADGLMPTSVADLRVALYIVDDQVYATSDVCTHGAASLSQGYLEGHVIECPLHQGQFDVRTGAVLGLPCKEAIRAYPVRVEGGRISVGISTVDALPTAAADGDPSGGGNAR